MTPRLSTSPALSVCPDRDALAAFALGRLSEAEIDSIAEHLDTCPNCASLLDALHASPETDSVQEQVRRCLLSPSPREIAAWDAIEEQLTVPDRPGAVSPTDFRVDQDVGGTLAGYHLLERLGKGGMGVVYRAVQLALGRQVAVKTLHHQALDSPALCARFRTEGTALARLDHPGIVRVLDLAEHQGTPLLVMELVEGQTLAQRLRAGWLDFRQAAELVRDLAVAVAYAHSRGVLHRDLKPSNVLLDAAGTPRVADFGLAKLLDRDDGLTSTELVLGTPAYMSPEQAGGLTSRIGPAADVWAMGVILYECLTGRPPFQGDSKPTTLDLVRTAPLLPPSRRRHSIPAGLEAICLHCLEKDPARRYPGAAALADDLGRWLAGQRPGALPRRRVLAWRFLCRHRLATMLTLALLLFLGSFLYFYQTAVPAASEQQGIETTLNRLAAGPARDLLDPTGKPRWLKVLQGAAQLTCAAPGEQGLQIQTAKECVLELAETPPHECYRFTAAVRVHGRVNRNELTSEAGISLAHEKLHHQGQTIHRLVQLTFNDVTGPREFPIVRAGSQGKESNVVMLRELLLVESPGKPTRVTLNGLSGPAFVPAGEERGQWHDLAITVTPTLIVAEWDGQRFSHTVESWLARGTRVVRDLRPRLPANHFLHTYQPSFQPSGGVGLYVNNGVVRFRDVRLTPLYEMAANP